MAVSLLLVYLAMGVVIAFVFSRVSGQPVRIRIGNVLNAVVYVGGALLLRAVGVPPLVAYLWPAVPIAVAWLVRGRERRIANTP